MTYPELVAADGASHYWRLNEAAGPFAADSIGTADGAIGAVVTFGVPGAVPGDPAMHFDGASGRISVAQQIPFTNAFSVEAWFKLDAGSGAGTTLPLVCTQAGPGAGVFWLEVLDGGMTLRALIADTPTTQTFLLADTGRGLDGLVDGSWHHVVWVFPLNLPNVAVYLDGVSVAVNKPPSLFYATVPIYLGYNPTSTGARYFKGALDEIAFYPLALTATQVAQHNIAATSSPVTPPVVVTTVPDILIEGTHKTTMVRSTGTFRFEYQLGARGRADLEVRDYDSFESAYRPRLDHAIVVEGVDRDTIPVVTLFNGGVFNVNDLPLGEPGVGTVTGIQAMDNWRYAARRLVKESYPSLYLYDLVGDVINKYLASYGIALDPATDRTSTPILPPLDFDYNTVEDVFNRLAVITSWVYRLIPTGLVQWFLIGRKPRGVTFSAGNDNIIGPVTWSQTQEARANRLIIRYGSGLVDKAENFVGDGVTRSFPLKWKLASPGWIKYPIADQTPLTQTFTADGLARSNGLEYYQTNYPALQEYQNTWPNVVGVTPPGIAFPAGFGAAQLPNSPWWWDAPNHCMVHNQAFSYDSGSGPGITPAGVVVNIAPYLALNQEGVGGEGAQLTDLYKWHYDAATNAIVSTYPNPIPAGVAFTFEYQVQYPLDVIVLDAADIDAHGIIDELRTEPTIFEENEAVNFGNGLLRKRTVTPRTVNIRTRAGHDFLPGDTVQLDVPSRTLPDAPWLVTNVAVSVDKDQLLTTTLTLLEGSEAQGSWIDFWRHAIGASGNTQGSSGTSSGALRARAGGSGSFPPPPPGPTVSYFRAGGAVIDSSGIFISPIGTGLYAAPNAVRWSTAYSPELDYRTAIWRADATTPNPIKTWHFDNIQLHTDTVIVQSVYTTKLVGIGGGNTVYRDLVISHGASSYWRLNEAAGTTAVDVVGGKNGTISGGVTLGQPGAIADSDPAMTFDGTTGQIVTAATVAIPLDCTIEAWVKTTSAAMLPVVTNQQVGGTPASAIFFGIRSGEIYIKSDAVGELYGRTQIADGQWHHAVWVLSGGSAVALYIDGALETQGGAPFSANTLSAAIGFDPQTGAHFSGSLDDVAIYPRVLSVSEIAAKHAAGSAPGTAPYYGEALLRQQGKGSAGECEILSIAHRHDGTLNVDRWAGTWAWTGNQDPDPTAQFGLWTTAVGPAVGFPPDCGLWVTHAAISAHVGGVSPVLIDATGAHLTIIPTCPTAPPGTSTTQIASTEFVKQAIGGGTGGGMNLDYLGNFVTGPVYNDGDIVIASDGIAYMCVVDGTLTPPEPWPGVGIATSVGPPGPQGPKGDKGDKGDPGVNAAVDATYWTVSPHPTLTNERALNTLANGYVKSTAGEPSIVAIIPVAEGGTGANNATTARANLGVGNVGTLNINGAANYYLDGTGAWSIPPTAVGVPSGMIAIFATACPAGWTRVAGWDGRYLRAAAAYGAMGGAYTHAHGVGSLAGGSHAHGVGSYAGPSHNHGAINIGGNTGSAGGHAHHFGKSFSGVTAGSNQGTMNVDAGNSGFMARGDHMHNFSGSVDGDTDAGGDHTHAFSGSGTPNMDGGQAISGTSAAATVPITGATDAQDHQPPFVDVVFCQKN